VLSGKQLHEGKL